MQGLVSPWKGEAEASPGLPTGRGTDKNPQKYCQRVEVDGSSFSSPREHRKMAVILRDRSCIRTR
jgi:hypothetical protein